MMTLCYYVTTSHNILQVGHDNRTFFDLFIFCKRHGHIVLLVCRYGSQKCSGIFHFNFILKGDFMIHGKED